MTVRRIATALGIALLVLAGLAAPAAAGPAGPGRTPVVLFPAFHFTRLTVTVRGQTSVPGCPRDGTFTDAYRAAGTRSPTTRA